MLMGENSIYLIKETFIYYYVELCVNSFVSLKNDHCQSQCLLSCTEKIF